MAGYDDDIHRFAHDNAVFHDIIQHYDDTARPDHDDIDYNPADLDNLDGAEYDNNGDIVSLIGVIGGVIYDICDAIEHYGSFDDIPDDYDFDGSDEDDDPTCQFVFFLNFSRRDINRCSRTWPYIAPGDDDDDPGSPTA